MADRNDVVISENIGIVVGVTNVVAVPVFVVVLKTGVMVGYIFVVFRDAREVEYIEASFVAVISDGIRVGVEDTDVVV